MKKLIILLFLLSLVFVSCTKRNKAESTCKIVENSASHIFGDTSVDIGNKRTYQDNLKSIAPANSQLKTINDVNNQGVVAYKIPSEMKIRNTSQVLVRISKTKTNIYLNLRVTAVTSAIPITQTMEVKLIDPSPSDSKNFDIIPDNDAIQIVDNCNDYTQWTWNVTPLKTGKAKLKIMVSIIIDGDKKEKVYEDTVMVKMDVTKEATFLLSEYWQWLFTTLIIPFGVWLYNKRKNHLKKKAS